ncbi:protein of unknown function [Paraburkholderia dioscoreae]|uniref:Uncharacterized protein n=1 Tax=Paraburkholderia dioscoreae TaxID=2604047 RepID=A0A5Q4ZIT7_9BURK|nr:protein of unknown function [Paraburkholderia dioscoreae]
MNDHVIGKCSMLKIGLFKKLPNNSRRFC